MTTPHETAAPGAHPAPPSVFVIFGGGGDLTKRKLIPALYNLASRGLLPKNFAVVGVDRSTESTEAYHEYLEEQVPPFIGDQLDRDQWEAFKKRVYSHRLDFLDDQGYAGLAETLAEVDKARAPRAITCSTWPRRRASLAASPHSSRLLAWQKKLRMIGAG